MVENENKKRKYYKPTKAKPQENKPINVKSLPADLILEILLRTPAKSLVRCKCASKSWSALIDHPKFIQLHLNFNSSRNKLLLCNTGKLIALLGLSHPPIALLHIDRDCTTRPDYPGKINFADFSKNMFFAGSIDGVVCLANFDKMFVALWNPSINHWNLIAPAVYMTMDSKNMSVGLGYDAVTNDYNIICILPSLGDFRWSFVRFYSVNQGCWLRASEYGGPIVPFCPNKDLRRCNFIIRGAPYWVGFDEGEATSDPIEVLGRIDPCTGSYKKILYPQHVKNSSTKVHPVNLRDSVAALIQFPGKNSNQMVDLYVLDESTAEWTKMYSVGPLAFEGLRIPQCFSTGEIVLETWTGDKNHASNMVTYFCDPKTNLLLRKKEIEELNPLWCESYAYVESLVCVKGMVQIGKEHKDNKKTNSKIKNWTEFFPKEFEWVLNL